ncbi:ProQ/FinO family protein [uncultured Thiodictyon sp.]|uniref:ProQ/FinO family protein n=1 Tax=uncultured Thiodictyon sp. TaxID=1846217 RepID=UPI0025F46AAD|nr:ProQ/FinO family protein [uncultured Thiodictyon sp.]
MSPTLTLNAPVAPTAPAPVRSRDLAAEYPACFDWESPRPLKRHIHKDLARIDQQGGALPDAADGAQRQAAAFQVQRQVKSALADYCTRRAYLAALRPGAARIDLHGQPAGVVTEREAGYAQALLRGEVPPPRPPQTAAPAPDLPQDAPLHAENIVSGHLELTVKFSQLPTPVQVQAGLKIGIQTDRALVVAILPPKAWKKLAQAADAWPHWVAALSGRLGAQVGAAAGPVIVLEQPALQVFEKKAKPAADAT